MINSQHQPNEREVMDANEGISAAAEAVAKTRKTRKTRRVTRKEFPEWMHATALNTLGRIDSNPMSIDEELRGKVLLSPVLGARDAAKFVTRINRAIGEGTACEAIFALEPAEWMDCCDFMWKFPLCFCPLDKCIIAYAGPFRKGFSRYFSKMGHIVMPLR